MTERELQSDPPVRRKRLSAHNDILELIVRNASLAEILQVITAMVEDEIPGSRATILLLDESGQHVQLGAGPSLPVEFHDAIDGAAIGPAAGTCGTAAYHNRVVITPDIGTDPAWDEWRPVAESAGLVACWSTPFAGEHGRVLGTFAVYFGDRRVPQNGELALLEDASYLAAVAVQHDNVSRLLRNTSRTHPLTGIPNRLVLSEALRRIQAHAAETGERYAVVHVSIEGMGPINEALGPTVGDDVLRSVARRLTEVVGDSGLAAHLWATDFAVLLGQVDDVDEAVAVANRIRDVLGDPLDVEGMTLVVDASIGVACLGAEILDQPRPEDEALRAANVAAQRAKADGSQHIGVHDRGTDPDADVVRLAPELRRGLDEEELTLAYQPVVYLGDDRVDHYEALLRWTTPHGAVPPEAFVRVAERAGLVADLGRYALRRALAELARARAEGRRFGMSVNLSVRQLSDETLPDDLGALLDEHALPPCAVTVEVTEGVMLSASARGWDRLQAIREHGVRISLDDFGTGYAQLPYLRRFTFDEIKVDRSFVAAMDAEVSARALIVGTVAFAGVTGATVVAEGVERRDQANRLRELGCTHGQGFLFGAPRMTPSGYERPRPRPKPRVNDESE